MRTDETPICEHPDVADTMLTQLGTLGWNVALYRSRDSGDTTIDAWRDDSFRWVRINTEDPYQTVVELASIIVPEMLDPN